MTRNDTAGIMALLETAYPTYYAKAQDNQKRMEALNLWAEMFRDDPVDLVGAAVKAIIAGSVNAFPPSIGEIKAKMRDLTSPEELSDGQAWALVSAACSNGIYGYRKEFDKLPPLVQAAVGRPEQLKEWAIMDVEELQSVVASNFMRSYRTVAKRHRDMEMLPDSVKAYISATAEKLALPGE